MNQTASIGSQVKTAGARVVLPAVLLAIASTGIANAQPSQIQYRDRVSGVAAPSSFDGNGDGLPAHYVTFDGWSTLGLVNGGLMVEYDFPNIAPDARCPTGLFRLPILASAGNRALTVRALALEGGQVFMRDDETSALACLDPTTGAFTMSIQGKFEGGLGTLAGASGNYTYEGQGQVLLQDANGLPFGGFTLETKGTINLP